MLVSGWLVTIGLIGSMVGISGVSCTGCVVVVEVVVSCFWLLKRRLLLG